MLTKKKYSVFHGNYSDMDKSKKIGHASSNVTANSLRWESRTEKAKSKQMGSGDYGEWQITAEDKMVINFKAVKMDLEIVGVGPTGS